MHWTVWQEDKPFVPNLEKFGFVYVITHIELGKAYVGCKQYFRGKTKKQMKWETYTGSSKYLNADIEKGGKEKFKFEVIAEYINKRSLHYYEAYYQMKWDVLTATLKDSDDPAYYNSYVGGKWFRPIESYTPPTEETKKKMSEAKLGEKNHNYLGKAEFYLEGKRMVVDCLGAWCRENGYNKGNLFGIAITNRDGCIKDKAKKNGKTTRFKCKGPLGIITKVKWLDNGKQ